jgi:Type IV secretion-system coupling protein DNA-binding domain
MMYLHRRISLAAWMIRLVPALLLIGIGSRLNAPVVGLGLGVVWFFGCRLLLRRYILPALFTSTLCWGCRRIIPLTARWKCGDHYTDHRKQHILRFFCTHGHRLEAFDCPRCRSTITVQKGDPRMYRHGTALRLRTLSRSTINGEGSLLIGHDDHRCPVLLPRERLAWHMAITGGTGRGKSTLLLNMLKHLAEDGTGFTVLDPGGDLARAIVQQIPPGREAQTLYVDVADREHPCPLNILSAQDAAEGALLSEELLGVFHKLYGDSWGPLLAHQLRMALRTIITVGGTLRDVYSLFVDNEQRARHLARLADPDLRMFWTKEFPAIPVMRRSAVTNKLAPIVFHPVLGPMLCAKTCALDFDRVIRDRGCLLVNLETGSPTDDVATLLGTFLVRKVIAAAFRQTAVPYERRIPHILVVDEFQRFMHKSAGFDQVLAEARKYRLALLVANQFVDQLSDEVRAAIFGNVGCLAAFRVGHRDARVLVPEFSGAVPADLMELERGQCLVRIGTEWTQTRTLAPPRKPEADPTDRIIALARAHRMQETVKTPKSLVFAAKEELSDDYVR